MLKHLVLIVVAGSGLLMLANEAQAGRRRCCGCGYAPAPVVVPAPAPAPAPVAPAAPMAAAPQGYRTYSYEPAEANYQPYGSWVTGRAYESAINKSIGRGY
jgi:hypothetical protein